MSDAMKAALLRKMEEMKAKHGEVPAHLMDDQDAEPDSTDLAPDLHPGDTDKSNTANSSLPGHTSDNPMMMGKGGADSLPHDAGDASHHEILKTLAHGAPEGRAPQGLREHAAAGAKAKFMAMKNK